MVLVFDEAYELSAQRLQGGVARATAGEVYEAQRAADRAGGQSYSEADRFLEILEDQVGLLRENFGAELEINRSAFRAFLTGQLDLQRAQVERGIPNRFFQDNVRDFDAVRDFLDQAKAQDPNHFKTLDEIREQVAREARAAQDAADAVAARATGFSQFLGQAGAGLARDVREPLIVLGAAVTAPIALESFGASLFARGLGLAVTEGTTGGVSEYLIQEGLRDFYTRQGYSDEEVSRRIVGNVAGAAVGSALLAPGIYLGGVGLKTLGSAVLERLVSSNPKAVLQAAEEIQAAGVSLTGAERADLAIARQELRFTEAMPPNFARTPDNVRFYRSASRGVLDALETGQVPPALHQMLDTPVTSRAAAFGTTSDLALRRPEGFAIEGLDLGAPFLRDPPAGLRGVRDTLRFIDQRGDDTLARAALDPSQMDARVREASEVGGSIVANLDEAVRREIAEAANQQRLVDTLNRATNDDAARTAEALEELGFEGVRMPQGYRTRTQILNAKAHRQFTDALNLSDDARRLVDQGVPVAEAQRQAGRQQEILEEAGEVDAVSARLEAADAGEFDDDLDRLAAETLDEELATKDSPFTREDLEAHKAEFDDIAEDEEALEAFAQCVIGNAA